MRRWSILTVLASVVLVISTGCTGIRPPRGVSPTVGTLLATGYCSCGKCCGWRRTWYGRPVICYGPHEGRRKQVGLTASGAKARRGTIAADTSRYPFGTVMYVEGYGYGRVEDRGSAIKGEHIDLFFPSHGAAKHWGRKRVRVKVWFASPK